MILASCHISREQPPADDYAAWSATNRDGTWTRAAENAVAATSLPDQVPRDIRKFCARYSELRSDSRIMFWAGLLSAMAKYESSFNPETAFTETLRDSHGNNVISRGLLQISIESANQDRYACKAAAAKDLHDPVINLSCGAQILAAWVEADGAVTSTDGDIVGGARYWSVLRAPNPSLEKISAITRDFPFCAAQ